MKFLKLLLNSKVPKSERLLDIALILSILPHLMVMKSFMLLYIFIALLFILKKEKKERDKNFLMLIGLLLIGLSFFSSYNFSNFSRMQFFVSFISSLLIYAVTLQKMTKEVNVYLKLSPILLMILSFFFFNSIAMLIYSISTLYIFVLLYIWSRMNEPLLEVVKFTAKLFIAALPLVVILFMVFPRISIQKSDFGFRADRYSESGFDGSMKIGADALKLSNRVVMEVLFKGATIKDEKLYFRGSTLSRLEGSQWKRSFYIKQTESLKNIAERVNYEVTIYPHAKKWIYALDIPLNAPKNVELRSDYTLLSTTPLYSKKRFQLHSALHYNLFSKNIQENLYFDREYNKQTQKALQKIDTQTISAQKKAEALMEFFVKQKLHYTLKPSKRGVINTTDSFLFQTKDGYCVHFASAFAISARILGIPSRVVTGFQANREDMLKEYLLVRASDAHAWVELYFKEDGWVRFDPTHTAIQNDATLQAFQENKLLGSKNFELLNRYFMYGKYIINNWILHYNRIKQMAILDKLLNDTLYLLKFLLSFAFLILISSLFFILIKSKSCKDVLMCEMQKLLKILEKKGFKKELSQSMQDFLETTQKESSLYLEPINKLYHSLKYKREYTQEEFEKLQKEIQKVYEESKSLKLS